MYNKENVLFKENKKIIQLHNIFDRKFEHQEGSRQNIHHNWSLTPSSSHQLSGKILPQPEMKVLPVMAVKQKI